MELAHSQKKYKKRGKFYILHQEFNLRQSENFLE